MLVNDVRRVILKKVTVDTNLQMCKRKFLFIKYTHSYSTQRSGVFLGHPVYHLAHNTLHHRQLNIQMDR